MSSSVLPAVTTATAVKNYHPLMAQLAFPSLTEHHWFRKAKRKLGSGWEETPFIFLFLTEGDGMKEGSYLPFTWLPGISQEGVAGMNTLSKATSANAEVISIILI